MASGDLVAFLDADDQWESEKLEQCAGVFRQWPEVGLVASRYKLLDSFGETVRIAGPELTWCHRLQRVSGAALLEFAQHISTPTVVVRRSLLEKHRFDETLATAEDRDLWFRLLTAADAWFLPAALSVVHLRADSLSHGNISLDCRCMLRVIDRYQDSLGALITRREQSYVHYKWATGLPGGWPALGQLFRALWLWPLPYARNRTRGRWARPRTLAAVVRRSIAFS